MTILYYTGTGNSLAVAKGFKGERISIPQAMNQKAFTYEDDEIGIVCPLYCHMPPKMVQEFLEKATLSATYIFVIFTYGNRKCDGFEWMDEFTKKNGIHCNYIDAVKMVDNFLPSFDMAEQMAMDKDFEGQMNRVIFNVNNHKEGYEKTTEEEILHHKKIMEMAEESPELFDGTLLQVTEECVGCGTCVKVCPNGKYRLQDGRAIRQEGSCDYCQACAQNCPKRAIVPGRTDKNPNARFRNQQVTIQELMEANYIKKTGEQPGEETDKTI